MTSALPFHIKHSSDKHKQHHLEANKISLEHVQKVNRTTLKSVNNWIHREDWNSPPSLFNYGLPNDVYHLINADVSSELTEVDLLCYFLTLLQNPICYLEIGVSVGKTFYQVVEFISSFNISQCSIHALDIERINPILKDLISKKSKHVLESSSQPNNQHCIIQKEKNTTTKWLLENDNEVTYYEANEFDETVWKSMQKKYNVIFSDALHEPSALLQEYKQLKQNGSIDFKQFIYCFDDLEERHGPMWQAVIQIYNDMKTLSQTPLYIHHYVVNGWLGNNEYPHNFGVLTNVILPAL